jgi:kynurenine formamidase
LPVRRYLRKSGLITMQRMQNTIRTEHIMSLLINPHWFQTTRNFAQFHPQPADCAHTWYVATNIGTIGIYTFCLKHFNAHSL